MADGLQPKKRWPLTYYLSLLFCLRILPTTAMTSNLKERWPLTYYSSWYLRFFPTCQVRVVRFYHSCSSSASAASSSSSFLLASFLANLLRRSCLASSGSQCAPLDLNRKDPIAVCTPGPQPQGSERSVHAWTSTARIPSQCAHLDLNRKDPIAVCIPGPQPQGSDRSVHPWTSTARIRSQCAPLDLNRKNPIAVCTAGPQRCLTSKHVNRGLS